MKIEPTPIFTYHTLSDKEKKNLEIFELMRKKGAISRTDISKTAGINMVSISNYIKEYIAKGLVLESGLDISTGGRKPELVELHGAANYVIGIGINREGLRGALTDLTVKVVEKASMSAPSLAAKDEIADRSIAMIQELIKKSKAGQDRIRAVGIGIADTDLVSAGGIADTLGMSVYAGGDAACAAFAEKRLNPAADIGDLLYMYSDVGCGVVIKDDACFGATESAGGMHIPEEGIGKKEKDAFCANARYLAPWDRSLGAVGMAKAEVAEGIGTKIVELANGRIDDITQGSVIGAAKENDEVASDIIHRLGINLGLRAAYLVNLFDPEVVVIGGGVEAAGELILDPIRKMVKRLAFAKRSSPIKIIPSVLGEDAVCMGAASLAIREVFLKA